MQCVYCLYGWKLRKTLFQCFWLWSGYTDKNKNGGNAPGLEQSGLCYFPLTTWYKRWCESVQNVFPESLVFPAPLWVPLFWNLEGQTRGTLTSWKQGWQKTFSCLSNCSPAPLFALMLGRQGFKRKGKKWNKRRRKPADQMWGGEVSNVNKQQTRLISSLPMTPVWLTKTRDTRLPKCDFYRFNGLC